MDCSTHSEQWSIIAESASSQLCSIVGGLDGDGLEVGTFLPTSCEALLLVEAICFQHICIRIQSFIAFFTVVSRDDKIGLIV